MGIKKNDPRTIPGSPLSCLGPFIKLSIFKGTVQEKHDGFLFWVELRNYSSKERARQDHM